MSKYIRSSKRRINAPEQQNSAPKQPEKRTIHATVRGPLSHAAVGLASVMLASTSAAAQDAATPPNPGAGTVAQQTPDATTLPKISVRQVRRTARPRPAPAPAPAAPATPAPAAQSDYQAPPSSSIGRLGVAPLRNTPQTV